MSIYHEFLSILYHTGNSFVETRFKNLLFIKTTGKITALLKNWSSRCNLRQMKEIIIAISSKDNISEDIHAIANQFSDEPELIIASGKETRKIITDLASNMFLNPKTVLAVVDPGKSLIEDLNMPIALLRKSISIAIFSTNPSDKMEYVEGKQIVIEQDKEKRLKEKVRVFLRNREKKMTDKAFVVLTDRIRDESILEAELTKLIAYVGDKTTIESKDIRAIISETQEETLLNLFEAFQRSDKATVLAVFENLLENGQHMLAIHSYLVNQIRLLLQAKDMDNLVRGDTDYPLFSKAFKKWKESFELKSAEKRRYLTSQHPFYAFKLSKTARKIPRKNLLEFFDMLASLDIEIKTGTKYDRARMEYNLLKV